MTVVQTGGALADLQPPWMPSVVRGGFQLYDQYSYDYATLYRTQPNVRTCVDFLARNVAQLGLHVFRRVSETDRQRLRDHPLALLIAHPNSYTTRYRLIESLMADLGVYYNAYWLKVPSDHGSLPLQLLRIPPYLVRPYGGLVPRYYEVNFYTKVTKVTPDQIVHFRGYNPDDPIAGLSPLETLRRILAEEHAMGDYREHYWRNTARQGGVIERPGDAPEWSEVARERFRQEFETLYSGSANSGKTAILEDGMTWRAGTFSAQESEYLGARKLTREECARSYHIPLPMAGILDNANFANMREAHKQLYQDCLGPTLAMLEDDIELQLLPEFGDAVDVYVEINIAEKLQGDFEEQAGALQSSVGRPWMTANEARARQNLPSLAGDADRLVTPLNVLIGGLASPNDTAPKATLPHVKAAGELDPTMAELRQRHVAKWREVMSAYFARQYATISSRVKSARAKDGAGIELVWIDGERWDTELGEDVLRLNTATALVWARHVADALGMPFDAGRMEHYLAINARNTAVAINATTREQVMAALLAVEPKQAVQQVYEIARTSRTDEIATSKVTQMSSFGSHEGAKQSGLATKTWKENSGNPREAHAAIAGETVGIGDLFSNGARWPGDPILGAAGNANCLCSLTYGR